jgi:plastocyanin
MLIRSRALVSLALVASTTVIVACGGGEKAPKQPPPSAAPAAGAPSGPLTPAAGHQVIKVEVTTDEKGVNKFVPARIEARQGDVLRFTLVTGVHNVDFLPDSNPGVQGLPPASELLQVPGQTHDIAVSFKPGHYYFQCDPHALLGMKGRLEVEEK